MSRSSAFHRLKRIIRLAMFCEGHGVSTSEGIERFAAKAEAARRARLSRRDLLATAGKTAVLGAVASAARAGRAFAARPPTVDVGIVGGGIAGLTCADTLRSVGVNATVYEARDRLGGRIWSMGGAFPGPVDFPGQVVERGGEFIDTTHLTMKSYAQEFDLKLEDVEKAWLPELRQVMGPLVKEAGKTLVITTGTRRGDLNLEFDSDTDTTSKSGVCGVSILGEDAGEVVFVKAHKELRVCNAKDPVTGKQDTRRVLRTSWQLGPALANTGIHELGHFIANLDHVNDSMNFMSTMGPPVAERTLASQREFWAGKKMFTDDQKKKLVKQLKDEKWLGDMEIIVAPAP